MPILEALLLTLIAWSVLAFGGVYPWGYWSIAIAGAAIGLSAIVKTRPWQDRQARRAMWCLLAVVLAIGIQRVPLPVAAFERLNPAGAAVLAATDLGYVVRPPVSHPLALVPDRAAIMMAIVGAFAVLLVGLLRAVARFNQERVVKLLTLFGVLLSVLAVVQRAMNAQSNDSDGWQLVYGFWKPRQAGNVFGPFINRNHFAGWMLMVLPLTIGYSCAVAEMTGPSSRHNWRRWLSWLTTPAASRFMTMTVAVLVMGTALILSGSRLGIAGLAVSLLVLGAFVARRVGGRRARGLAIGYLAALMVAGVAWAGIGTTVQRFSLARTDLASRVSAWRDTLRIVRDFPVFGTGVGSYGRAMLVYQTDSREKFYAQAHNDYLQVLAEGGLLVAVPVAICLAGIVLGARRRVTAQADGVRTYWIRAGAIAGVSAIAAQSLMDFSLQIPANTLLCVLIIALALHRPSRPVEHAPRV